MTQQIEQVLQERGARYGSFDTHAEITQDFKRVLDKHLKINGKEWPDILKEAADMIFHKLGRAVNGDPLYADTWVDIAGYAQLVAQHLEKFEQK
jgi:hypothetical protein